jgi:hypothetical protein
MKKRDGYELTFNSNPKVVQFKFTSVSEKKSIDKIVEFDYMDDNIWNLGFGDLKGDDWQDNVISNNDDLAKVLQTVANTIHIFFEEYPNDRIYISPLDKKRKILYNRIFKQRWHEIEPIFTLKARIISDLNTKFENYNPLEIYDEFVVGLRKLKEN